MMLRLGIDEDWLCHTARAELSEIRLCAAVLEDAIFLLRSKPRAYTASGYRNALQRRKEAERWIESDSNGPFSFHFVCQVLNLDPQAVRAAINEAWEHGGADFQLRFDKSTAQAEQMKAGALRVL
jgi:hypothetical protein